MQTNESSPKAATRPVRARVISVAVVVIIGSVFVGQAVNGRSGDASNGAPQSDEQLVETTTTPLPVQPVVPQGWARVEAGHVAFAMPGAPVRSDIDVSGIAPNAGGASWTTSSDGKVLVAMVADWGTLLSDADAHSMVSALVQLAVDESNGGSVLTDTERPAELGFRRYVEISFPDATYFGYYAAVGSVVVGIAGFSDDGTPPLAFETLIDTLTFDGN